MHHQPVALDRHARAAHALLLALLIALALVAPRTQAWAQAPGWHFIMFGQVMQVQGLKVTFRTPDNKQGQLEISPQAICHDASQPFPSLTSPELVHPNDIVVVATDAEQKTHIAIARYAVPVDRGWDGIFAKLVPGYTSVYPAAGSSPQGTMPAASTDVYHVRIYGRIQGGAGQSLQVNCLAGAQAGKSITVEVPAQARYHDTSQPPTSSSSPSEMRVGDEVMLTSDSSDAPHVLFLHNGAQMSPAWAGLLKNECK